MLKLKFKKKNIQFKFKYFTNKLHSLQKTLKDKNLRKLYIIIVNQNLLQDI